jgi:hypothetical protein
MTTLLAQYFSCCEAFCAPSAGDIDELCGGNNIEQDNSIFWDPNDENDDGLNKNPSSSIRIASGASGRVQIPNTKPPVKSNAMVRDEGKTAAGNEDELDKMLEDMGKQRYPRASERFLNESDTLYRLIT